MNLIQLNKPYKHIEINIGKACNHKCIFCMSGMSREKLLGFEQFDSLKTEIKNLSDLGYNSIGFLGGEPTIHPKFLDLLQYTQQYNFENIEVITNGSKFHNKKYLLESIKYGLTRISLSIHSMYSKQEAILTGGIPGVLEQKIEAIKNIIYFYNKGLLKRELSVNIVISKVNYKDIKKLILFLRKLGVRSFRLNFIQLEGYSVSHYEKLALKHEEFTPYLKEIIELAKDQKDIRVNFEAIPWCYSGLNYQDYVIYSEQNIDREKDKISRDDIDLVSRDIMNQLERRKELKVYLNKCSNCFLKSQCEGLWKRQTDYFKLV